jgi:hypothetical protein
MAEYSFEDGKGMKYNVLIPKEESVLETYPDLAAIFEDMREQLIGIEGMKADEIVRYIVLVYHIKSPLIAREENIIWRKKRAMLILGKTLDPKGFFAEPINKIIANQNQNIIDLKMRFLKFENNLTWLQLCNTLDLFFECQRIIGMAITGEGKKSEDELMKIRLSTQKDAEVLESKLEKLAGNLFVGDLDLLNFVGSAIVKEDIRNKLSMESRAKI